MKPVSDESAGYSTRQALALNLYTDGLVLSSAHSSTLNWRKSILLTGVFPEWQPRLADWTRVNDV